MIKINLTRQKIEGEPGPNFYWRGECKDYLQLVNDLHELGTRENIEVSLNELKYLTVSDGYSVIAMSSKNEKTLVKITNKNINIKCDCNIWREILQLFLSISFYPSHNYVEVEGNDTEEDANFIISSEE